MKCYKVYLLRLQDFIHIYDYEKIQCDVWSLDYITNKVVHK